jgi:hypothetical protein
MIYLREIVGDDREQAILAVAGMGESRGGEGQGGKAGKAETLHHGSKTPFKTVPA